MIYDIQRTARFKKNYKKAVKRGLNIIELETLIEKLRTDQVLEEKYHDHELKGQLKGIRECHINPDWLLMYIKQKDVLILTLVDTGSHSDLFNK